MADREETNSSSWGLKFRFRELATGVYAKLFRVQVENVSGAQINPAQEDGNLATLTGKDFATQTTLALIKTKTDNIPTNPATESGKLTIIETEVKALIDDTIKGALRSIGDAGASPQNATGSTILRRLSDLDSKLSQLGEPKHAEGSSTSAALTVEMDCGGWTFRQQMTIWVKSNAAATFNIQGKHDGGTYRQIDSIVLAASGESTKTIGWGFRFIKVATDATNNNEIEVSR
ncbi:MAG: hypothetical protein PHV74_00170 [Dehalococcoidia bacterium]|nr:hypothetical protein [Dehalococcoidia bacterium]